MKTINLLAAMSLIAVFASPVLAGQETPFKGSLAMVQTGVVQGETLIVDGSGVGNATKLGRFSMTYQEQVDLSTGIGTGTGFVRRFLLSGLSHRAGLLGGVKGGRCATVACGDAAHL